MKNEEKIRKYIEGEMTGDELINFVNEINNSPGLKKEVDAYQDTLRQLKKIEKKQTDDSYFINLLPHFRDGLSRQKSLRIKPSFVYGSVIVLVLTLMVVFLRQNEVVINEKEQITFDQMDNEGLNAYLNSYDQNLTSSLFTEDLPEDYDSVFNSMIISELSLNGYSGEYFVDITRNDFNKIFNELSDEEMEVIYNNLITMNFR